MPERLVYWNGDFIPEREARLSIFDWALMYGDMLFEMTRTFAGKPFRLREHIERLYGSLRYAEIDCGLTIDEMEAATIETMKRNQDRLEGFDFQIMHDVTRGSMPQYETIVKEGQSPIVCIHVIPLVRHTGMMWERFRDGAHFVVPRQQSVPSRFLDPKAKNRSRLFYRVAELQAEHMDPGAMAVLTDEQGFLTEGTGNNFFMAKGGVIYTPKPHNILRGVSRHACMDIAARVGLEVREADIEPYDVRQADEAWFTSTPYSMVPITRFDFYPVGDGKRGPIFQRLLEAWSEEVGVSIDDQFADYAELAKTWRP